MAESSKKYPSPSKNSEFKKYWDAYIISIISRDNFSIGHLLQLEMLCNMHAEHYRLEMIVDLEGYSKSHLGRDLANDSNRFITKPSPEAAHMDRLKKQILVWTDKLGLLPAAGKGLGGGRNKEKDDEEWE